MGVIGSVQFLADTGATWAKKRSALNGPPRDIPVAASFYDTARRARETASRPVPLSSPRVYLWALLAAAPAP